MTKKINNKIKKSKQVKSRCLTYLEAFKLIDELDKVELKYKLIIHFAIVGGLRRSEILGIKTKDYTGIQIIFSIISRNVVKFNKSIEIT